MDDVKEKSAMVANNFTTLMDHRTQWSFNDLSDGAILDWFGRSLFGREAIINFLRAHVPKSHHSIESITNIPPINHRSLKKFEQFASQSQNYNTIECGQGDCKELATPENIVQPNFKDLVKAPKKRKFQNMSNLKQCQFLELRGKLEFEHVLYNGNVEMSERVIQRIVIAYTDQIHLIVYEGKNLCRKKLSSLFGAVNE